MHKGLVLAAAGVLVLAGCEQASEPPFQVSVPTRVFMWSSPLMTVGAHAWTAYSCTTRPIAPEIRTGRK